ncbi:adenylyltransferase/cytidyltransferase family protein [Brevibacillus porteri]|uniref:adenylyltransferase/cytidyltransferase family protein n=1 Tax=Brevibacillus porteri TaxID=2126350 RepID=UPI003D2200D9
MKTVHITHSSTTSYTDAEPCVMALGFFDGVHLGHRGVIQRAKRLARKHRVKLVVMTFYPHPKEVLGNGGTPVHYLTPFAKKEELLAQLEVDILYVIRFDSEFARMASAEFVERYIIGLQAKYVVAGFDFRYGYQGQGNMRTMKGDVQGKIPVMTIPKMEAEGQKVSSTLIREMLLTGRVSKIPRYLGTFYETSGTLTRCTRKGRGSKCVITEVTLDQGYTLPVEGRYEVEVECARQHFFGIASTTKCSHQSHKLKVEMPNFPPSMLGETMQMKWLKQV